MSGANMQFRIVLKISDRHDDDGIRRTLSNRGQLEVSIADAGRADASIMVGSQVDEASSVDCLDDERLEEDFPMATPRSLPRQAFDPFQSFSL